MSRIDEINKASELSIVGEDMGLRARDNFVFPRPLLESQLMSMLCHKGTVPVLVGDPGVGKTSMIQRIALQLADPESDAPAAIRGHRIFLLDPSHMEYGTAYSGDLEHKIVALSKNAASGKALLCLENVESFAGTGASSQNAHGDILSLFTPLLGRMDGPQLLATTTPLGWFQLVQARPGFARRCIRIEVPGMADEDIRRVLSGHGSWIAQRRGFIVDDSAIEAAIDLAAAVRPGVTLPGAACEMLHLGVSHQRNRFERDKKIRNIDGEVLTTGVAQSTGVARFLLSADATLPRHQIARSLAEQVIGQAQVIDPVADRINLMQHRLCSEDRPLGTFLLTGPTGVGKTELVKSVARLLHGHAEALVRFDMSEYGQIDSVRRLAGHQRRDEHGAPSLVDAALARPFPVILFDEIEKAHPNVFDLLLQVFGEARLTDGQGRVGDFRTALFFITSNLGANDRAIGFTDSLNERPTAAAGIPRAVQSFFRPEFVNRLTAVLSFRHLQSDAIREIARRETLGFAGRAGLASRRLQLQLDDAALERLTTEGYCHEFGARPMQRVVEQQVGAAIAACIEEQPDIRDTMLGIDCAASGGIRATAIAPLLAAHSPSQGSRHGRPRHMLTLRTRRDAADLAPTGS